jgi:hypothetical protein
MFCELAAGVSVAISEAISSKSIALRRFMVDPFLVLALPQRRAVLGHVVVDA